MMAFHELTVYQFICMRERQLITGMCGVVFVPYTDER